MKIINILSIIFFFICFNTCIVGMSIKKLCNSNEQQSEHQALVEKLIKKIEEAKSNRKEYFKFLGQDLSLTAHLYNKLQHDPIYRSYTEQQKMNFSLDTSERASEILNNIPIHCKIEPSKHQLQVAQAATCNYCQITNYTTAGSQYHTMLLHAFTGTQNNQISTTAHIDPVGTAQNPSFKIDIKKQPYLYDLCAIHDILSLMKTNPHVQEQYLQKASEFNFNFPFKKIKVFLTKHEQTVKLLYPVVSSFSLPATKNVCADCNLGLNSEEGFVLHKELFHDEV